MTAVIYRGPKRGFKLDDDDLIMLARAFVGEAGERPSREEASALFWCWMDRLHLMNAQWSQEGWPFWKLVQQHSIPVKPQTLDPNGSWCQSHQNDCTPASIARRKRIQSMTVAQLEAAGTWQFALEAQAGTLERTIAEPTYDFASCKRVKGVNVGGNCFQTYEYLSASSKKKVIPGEVTIDPSAEEITETVGSGAKLLLGVTVGYLLYRVGDWLWDNVVKKRK